MTDMNPVWLNARYLELDSTAQPGVLVDAEGTANTTAAILIGDDGRGVIIEGRPADLVQMAERILQHARTVESTTMMSPELLTLYGGTEPTTHEPAEHYFVEPSQVLEEYGRQALDDEYFEPPFAGDFDLQDPDEREV